jgi:putative transposase
VLRTITFKLRLTNQDCKTLLDTMRAYSEAFSLSAKWGFENQSWNKVDNHNATYKLTRQSIPDLPSSLVQCARDCACEALKAVKCKTLPERKPLSAMRYNQRVITVNLVHGLATIASTEGRIKAAFFVPSHYSDYLEWTIKSSTIFL